MRSYSLASGLLEGRRNRLDSNQCTVIFGGEDIQESVRTLAHVANAILKLAQQRLAMELFPLLVEIDAHELTGPRHLSLTQSAGEEVSLPGGKPVARVEREARCGNRRDPEDNRLFHPFLEHPVVHARAEIEASRVDDGPSVVLSGMEDVDLVAAIRPVLAFPDIAGERIHGQADHVAVAHRIDLGPITRATDKRIVWRHGAVVLQPQDLPPEAIGVLRRRRDDVR